MGLHLSSRLPILPPSTTRERTPHGRPTAQPLHHPAGHQGWPAAGGFIDRYVFPDGELTGSGRIITEAPDIGLEVIHEENLRHTTTY